MLLVGAVPYFTFTVKTTILETFEHYHTWIYACFWCDRSVGFVGESDGVNLYLWCRCGRGRCRVDFYEDLAATLAQVRDPVQVRDADDAERVVHQLLGTELATAAQARAAELVPRQPPWFVESIGM